MPVPLPNINSPEVQRMADLERSAYMVCLKHEEQFAAHKDKLRRGVRDELSKCIDSYKDGNNLAQIGEFFERDVLVPFKKFRGRTPSPSEHSARPSFEVAKNEMKAEIIQAPKDHKEAKALALIRDKWSCPVTGLVDETAPEEFCAQLVPPIYMVYTECAHIIPEAIFFGLEPKCKENTKLDYSASILAVLQRFCYDISSFNGARVHSLTNVITMEKNIHDKFDRLALYFEATSVKNRYKVESFGVLSSLHQREFVTFSTEDSERLPVPSPDLLAWHAACCKVARLSGAAEHIDSVYRDMETIGVLASDGTSDDMLQYLLSDLGLMTEASPVGVPTV